MNLVEVLLPSPNNFWIYTKDRQKIRIMGYNHINIDFLPQISYRNGDRSTTKNPTIFYTVYMDTYNQSKLFSLFDSEFTDIYQTKECYIGIKSKVEKEDESEEEYEEYIFRGRVSAIPSILKAAMSREHIPSSKEIKISLSLDNIGVDALYEEFTKSYKKYCESNEISRFELMDI